MKDRVERGRPDPYFLAGGPTACLLIHGFTGSPAEMAPVAEYLQSRGFTVHAPLLAGHGTTPEDMEKTGWRDWVRSAEAGYEFLAGRAERIYTIGLSMGGLLALHLAATKPVAGVVAMCAPIRLKKRTALLAPILRHVVRFIPKGSPAPPFAADLWSYDRTPVACVPHLLRLIRIVRRELGAISAPALVVQGAGDQTVDPESARFIVEHLGSRTKNLLMLANSGHLVTLDQDQGTLFSAIASFVSRIA
ncbi:MAG: alpha/beta fold hydrolase [Firmicutes bacterium]|nr:alpha/beta fold hydrolase [Bacillota bacterium]